MGYRVFVKGSVYSHCLDEDMTELVSLGCTVTKRKAFTNRTVVEFLDVSGCIEDYVDSNMKTVFGKLHFEESKSSELNFVGEDLTVWKLRYSTLLGGIHEDVGRIVF